MKAEYIKGLKTKIYMLPKSSKQHDFDSYGNCNCKTIFDHDWDNEKIAIEPDVIFYWYVSGMYEGSGELIAMKNGKWYIKPLSHCSCYGPLYYFAKSIDKFTYDSLDAIEKAGTSDWLSGYKCLIEAARKKIINNY